MQKKLLMINVAKKERGYHKQGSRVGTLFLNVLDLGYSLIHENSKDYSFENRITTKKKLPELYEELKDFDFEYAHNSYIVNLHYVIKMKSEGVLKLCNGCELNVSRSRLPDFRKALSRVMGEKYT